MSKQKTLSELEAEWVACERQLPHYLNTYHERKPVYDSLKKITFYMDSVRKNLARSKTHPTNRNRLLNGVPLTELERIINPVCELCQDYEVSGF